MLAQYLPEAIDKATPEGKLPPPDKDGVSVLTPILDLTDGGGTAAVRSPFPPTLLLQAP